MRCRKEGEISSTLFAGTLFTGGVLVVSSRADVLHPGQLAVGAAAINTSWQIGAFVSPYAFGLTRDSSGNFTLSLIVSALVAGAQAPRIFYVRGRVASGREAERALLLSQ